MDTTVIPDATQKIMVVVDNEVAVILAKKTEDIRVRGPLELTAPEWMCNFVISFRENRAGPPAPPPFQIASVKFYRIHNHLHHSDSAILSLRNDSRINKSFALDLIEKGLFVRYHPPATHYHEYYQSHRKHRSLRR